MPNSPFPFQHILVGLTAGPADDHLIRYARMLSGLAGDARFRFVHVLGAGADEGAPPSDADGAWERIAAAVHSRFPDGPSCHVLPGPRIDGLLDFAARERCDLILVGHRPERTGRRSMARRLAMKAPCSVWMAPSGAPVALDRVLAAVDFSGHSAHAVDAAARLAASAGLDRCLSLNVYRNDLAIGGGSHAAGVRRLREDEFRRFLAPLATHGVRVEPLLEESYNIAVSILSAARREGADLVVMGTRGRSPAAAVLLGSESEEVIRSTAVPVLIVKPEGERETLLEALLGGGSRPHSAAA